MFKETEPRRALLSLALGGVLIPQPPSRCYLTFVGEHDSDLTVDLGALAWMTGSECRIPLLLVISGHRACMSVYS